MSDANNPQHSIVPTGYNSPHPLNPILHPVASDNLGYEDPKALSGSFESPESSALRLHALTTRLNPS